MATAAISAPTNPFTCSPLTTLPANIKTIGDLVRREESEMLKFRNFGRKSLQELVNVLEERSLRFGMDVDKYLEEVG